MNSIFLLTGDSEMYLFFYPISLFFCVFVASSEYTVYLCASYRNKEKWTDLRRNTITAIIPCVKIKEHAQFREMEISLCCILYLFQIYFSFFSLSAELLTLYITSIGVRVKNCTMPLGRDFARAPVAYFVGFVGQVKASDYKLHFSLWSFFRITQSYK